jgi:hypothetical protein
VKVSREREQIADRFVEAVEATVVEARRVATDVRFEVSKGVVDRLANV